MNEIIENTRAWLKNIVIGLNLCPFASHPFLNNRVRIAVCETSSAKEILNVVESELELLSNSSSEVLETTLIVTPNAFPDFLDYNDFLSRIEAKIKKLKFEGEYQVASFHPDYQFHDTKPNDRENLTNRAPYPIFHLLREESLEYALANYSNPESIYENNIQTMAQLSDADYASLFHYLLK